MTRFTSRSFSAGKRSVTTCPIPIITYQETTSTPGGGKFLSKPVCFRWALISSRVFDSSWRRKMVSSMVPVGVPGVAAGACRRSETGARQKTSRRAAAGRRFSLMGLLLGIQMIASNFFVDSGFLKADICTLHIYTATCIIMQCYTLECINIH